MKYHIREVRHAGKWVPYDYFECRTDRDRQKAQRFFQTFKPVLPGPTRIVVADELPEEAREAAQ